MSGIDNKEAGWNFPFVAPHSLSSSWLSVHVYTYRIYLFILSATLKQFSFSLNRTLPLQCEAAAVSRIAAPQGRGRHSDCANLQRVIFHSNDVFRRRQTGV